MDSLLLQKIQIGNLNNMDLSKGLIHEEEGGKDLTKEFELLERYSGADKVMKFSDVVTELEKKREGMPELRALSKIPILDDNLEGFRPGQLIVISAPTGQGKTSLVQHLISVFSEQDIHSLLFSYEVPPLEILQRFAGKIPVFFVPRKNKDSNMNWLRTRLIESIAKFGTHAVFIDHLHFLLDMHDVAVYKNTSFAIGKLMRDLKTLAIETGMIIFLVSHMRKNTLEKVPDIEDLRDSSFVAQESDTVLVMWRHKEKDANSAAGWRYTNETRMIISKNRWNGRMSSVRMAYKDGRFIELDTRHEDNSIPFQ